MNLDAKNVENIKEHDKKNYGYKTLLEPNLFLLEISGLFPSKLRFINIISYINNTLIILLVATQIVDIYQLVIGNGTNQSVDPVLLLSNLRYSCVGIVTIIKSNTFMKWSNSWKMVFDYINESDREERKHRDEIRKKIVQNYSKYSKMVTIGYCTLTITTTIIVNIIPLMKYKFTPNYKEQFEEGLLPFPHILSVWVPFDKNTSPGCWILASWHIITVVYAGVVISVFDASMLVILIFFEKKLDLLQYRCSFIYKREEGAISDEEFFERVKTCHHEHNQYIENVKLFNSLLSPVLFFYVLVCSLFVCTSIFQLSVEISTAEKIMNLEMLVFSVTQLYMFCFYSNYVFHKSLEVSYGPYTCDWSALDVRKRRLIHLLVGKFQRSVVFTAGPFTDLKISTFVAILKGAYSFFTLLRE